jgi:hypothetical protein
MAPTEIRACSVRHVPFLMPTYTLQYLLYEIPKREYIPITRGIYKKAKASRLGMGVGSPPKISVFGYVCVIEIGGEGMRKGGEKNPGTDPIRARFFLTFKKTRNRFQGIDYASLLAWQAYTTTLFVVPARQDT